MALVRTLDDSSVTRAACCQASASEPSLVRGSGDAAGDCGGCDMARSCDARSMTPLRAGAACRAARDTTQCTAPVRHKDYDLQSDMALTCTCMRHPDTQKSATAVARCSQGMALLQAHTVVSSRPDRQTDIKLGHLNVGAQRLCGKLKGSEYPGQLAPPWSAHIRLCTDTVILQNDGTR